MIPVVVAPDILNSVTEGKRRPQEVMRSFHILVADDRYSVPNLRLVQALDEAAARDIADRVLAESGHHRGVEVWEDDTQVFAMAS